MQIVIKASLFSLPDTSRRGRNIAWMILLFQGRGHRDRVYRQQSKVII